MVQSWTKLLRRANEARRGETPTTPFQLWELAGRESAGVQGKRVALYRHAMVHAGYLLDADGVAYSTCPFCAESLGR